MPMQSKGNITEKIAFASNADHNTPEEKIPDLNETVQITSECPGRSGAVSRNDEDNLQVENVSNLSTR